MEDFKGQRFVMQPFDHARYDSLYEQVFDPAIRAAHLKPYRVDNDPGASIPIETIEAEIAKSLACFGEISEDNPNVWFELGFALAREKPLCLVCSDTRTKFPFDVQHRKIITYPKQSLPKDYEELKQAITTRLDAVSRKRKRGDRMLRPLVRCPWSRRQMASRLTNCLRSRSSLRITFQAGQRPMLWLRA
jgi:hypothetical protein